MSDYASEAALDAAQSEIRRLEYELEELKHPEWTAAKLSALLLAVEGPCGGYLTVPASAFMALAWKAAEAVEEVQALKRKHPRVLQHTPCIDTLAVAVRK